MANSLFDMTDYGDLEQKAEVDFLQSMPTRDKVALATSTIPVVGGITGTYADAMNMIENPEERTLLNAGLLATNLIPGSKIARTGINTQRAEEYAKGVKGGDPRKGDAKKGILSDVERVENITSETGASHLADIPKKSIFDYEGEGLVTHYADLTQGGNTLFRVGDETLRHPVRQRGGQNYMFNKENIRMGNLWASDYDVVNGKFVPRYLSLRKGTGKDPLFAPYTMTPTGGDFNHQTTETMLAYLDTTLGRTDKSMLNKKMKQIVPNWTGFESPNIQKVMDGMTTKERAATRLMLDRDYRNTGGLTVGEARAVNTDPNQIDAPRGILMNFGRMEEGVGTASNHPTFSGAVKGQPIGQFQEQFPATLLFSDKQLYSPERITQTNRFNPNTADMRSLEMYPRSTIITENRLRDVERYLSGDY